MSRDDVTWVGDHAEFAALHDEWEALAQPSGLPFLSHAWFDTWWRAFGDGLRLRVCTARRGGELVAIFPLYARGGRLAAMANEHTPVFRPLARDKRGLTAVVDEAVAAGVELAAPGLPSDDACVGLLAAAADRERRLTLVEHHQRSPIVETTGDVADYLRALSRNARRDTERRRRRLTEEQGATFDVVTAPDNLHAAVEEGLALEARSWKGKRGTAILSDERTARFYRELAATFGAADQLRLSSIAVGGRMIAFDLSLLDHGRLWTLKGAYDEQFSRYAPGIVLTLAEVKRCFELGLEALELLGDDDEWKRKFATSWRDHTSVRAYRLRPAPATRYLYRRLLRPVLRDAYRRSGLGGPIRRGSVRRMVQRRR